MAQNITIMGASYSAVPAVTLPKTGGGTASFTDVTDTTAAASDVASGKYFYNAAGVRTAGTSSGGADSTFVVTLSWNSISEMWEPDCTYAEVAAAYQAGKGIVVVTDDGYPASCIFEDDPYAFIYTVSVSSVDSYGLPIVTQMGYVLDQNGITSDGDYVTIYPEFASPSATYTPTTSQQTDTITFDPNDYNGIQQVNVTVDAMPSGNAGTPTATKGAVNNHSISVTPSVVNTTGYITGGTLTGTAVSISASELVNGTYAVNSSGTKDVTNYASASVPSGSATASAAKGSVSNHSVSVTPSVTRTAGWVSAGTASGTAVTVSASELVSGSETKTANGTYDVTNLASVVVALDFVTYYTSSSNPTSSQGSNGDIWLVTS